MRVLIYLFIVSNNNTNIINFICKSPFDSVCLVNGVSILKIICVITLNGITEANALLVEILKYFAKMYTPMNDAAKSMTADGSIATNARSVIIAFFYERHLKI